MAQPDATGASAPNAGSPSSPSSSPSFARRHWGKLTILTLCGLPLCGALLWTAVAMSYTYSSGTRTGYVQKISKKGWLCKTWEGEIAMATAPGVSPQIFTFSIRNDSLASALELDMGKGRVAVQYAEHRGVPTSCFGDTPYFVVSYRMIADDSRLPLP